VLNPPNITNLMQIDSRLLSFYEELEAENLLSEIQTEDDKTIFVPINIDLDPFLANQNFTTSEKVNFLKNHLMEGFFTTDFLQTGYFKNRAIANNSNHIDTYFNLTLGLLLNGTSNIIEQDIVGTN